MKQAFGLIFSIIWLAIGMAWLYTGDSAVATTCLAAAVILSAISMEQS